MKTLTEAADQQGVSLNGEKLTLHFSSLPNWYGCILVFNCPRCDQPIAWEWKGGNLPGITTPESIQRSGVKPEVKGGHLIAWGHRWIYIECDECHTKLEANNFD